MSEAVALVFALAVVMSEEEEVALGFVLAVSMSEAVALLEVLWMVSLHLDHL